MVLLLRSHSTVRSSGTFSLFDHDLPYGFLEAHAVNLLDGLVIAY